MSQYSSLRHLNKHGSQMIKSQVIFKITLESILFRNKENHTKFLVKFRLEEVKKSIY